MVHQEQEGTVLLRQVAGGEILAVAAEIGEAEPGGAKRRMNPFGPPPARAGRRAARSPWRRRWCSKDGTSVRRSTTSTMRTRRCGRRFSFSTGWLRSWTRASTSESGSGPCRILQPRPAEERRGATGRLRQPGLPRRATTPTDTFRPSEAVSPSWTIPRLTALRVEERLVPVTTVTRLSVDSAEATIASSAEGRGDHPRAVLPGAGRRQAGRTDLGSGSLRAGTAARAHRSAGGMAYLREDSAVP